MYGLTQGLPFTLPLALGLNSRDFSPEDGFLGMLSQLGDSLPSLLQPCLKSACDGPPPVQRSPLHRTRREAVTGLAWVPVPPASTCLGKWEKQAPWKKKDHVLVLLFPGSQCSGHTRVPGTAYLVHCALWSCPPSLGEELLKLSH